jgi:hypothetical protein
MDWPPLLEPNRFIKSHRIKHGFKNIVNKFTANTYTAIYIHINSVLYYF